MNVCVLCLSVCMYVCLDDVMRRMIVGVGVRARMLDETAKFTHVDVLVVRSQT